jgi:hypothetical protein
VETFPQNPKNHVPFKGSLVESTVSEAHKGRGKLFENNSDKIIRVVSFDSLEKRYHYQIDPVALASLGKKLYAELETKYGIPVPVEYVAGKDEQGRNVIYGITEKISGKNLAEVDIDPEVAIQSEKLYISLSQYYLDKLAKLPDGEIYLADINGASQYAYGTTIYDEQPKIYLVDTDLFMRNGNVAFYRVVAWFIRHMISVERRFGKKFEEARKNIAQTISNPLPEGLNDKEKEEIEKAITEAKNFLEGQFSKESDALPTGI